MKRVHGFEFNEQPWLPQCMTSWMTSVLHICHHETGDGYVWAPKVMELLDHSGENRILDLCSGGGGPVLDLVRVLEGEFHREIDLTLTDLIPNLAAAQSINGKFPRRTYVTQSINATDVPPEWTGVRTVFSGLHHMRPEVAFGFLKNAFDLRRCIFIGETTKRTLPTMKKYALAAKAFFDATKKINPTRIQSLLTFKLPVLPAMLGWDNVMSCIRTYTEEELRGFIRQLSAPDYRWEMGELYNPAMDTPYPYIMGRPTKRAGSAAKGADVVARQVNTPGGGPSCPWPAPEATATEGSPAPGTDVVARQENTPDVGSSCRWPAPESTAPEGGLPPRSKGSA